MDNKFSWMVIESDEKRSYLVLYNKKGLRKVLNQSARGYEDELEAIKAKREAMNKFIGQSIAEAIKWAMENPEEFKKRMERK